MSDKKTHIILVEDEPAHAELVERMFEKHSDRYTLTLATNLAEARVILEQSNPDLLIADYLLADGEGTALIPPDSETSLYPVLILTSHGNEQIAVDAMKAGAIDYVVKSESGFLELPRTVERVLREWQHILDCREALDILAGTRRSLIEQISEMEMLYESVPVGLGYFDTQLRAVRVNSVLAEMDGTPVEEHPGKTVRELVPELADYLEPISYKVIETAEPLIDHGFVGETPARPGELRNWKISLIPVKSATGKVLGLSVLANDVTEGTRKQIEINRFRAVLDQSVEAMLITDTASGMIIDVNQRACTNLGYTKEEILNLFLWDIQVDGASISKGNWDEHVQMVKGSNAPTLMNLDHRRKDGSTFPVSLIISYTEIDGQGFLLSSAMDITSQIEARKDLDESQQKYKRIVEGLKREYFFYTHDLDGIFTYISPSIKGVLGYSIDEFLTHFTEYITDNPANLAVEEHTKLSIEGKQQPTYQIEIYHKDRSVRTLEVLESPIFGDSGEVIYVEGIARDVTEKLKILDQLQKNERHHRELSAVVEQTHSLVMITDVEGLIEYVNPTFSRVTGYELDEVVGQNFEFLSTEFTAPKVFDELWKTIRVGKDWNGDFCSQKKDGGIFWQHSSISPMRSNDGVVTHYISVSEDITEKKRIDEALAKSEREAIVGRLAATVAHQVNNPLFAMKTRAYSLRKHIKDDEAAEEKLDIIRRQIDRIAHTTQALLGFSKQRASGSGEISISEVILTVVSLLESGINSDGIELSCDIESEMPVVEGDVSEIQEILVNLLENAREALKKGNKVSVSAHARGKKIEIVVQDDGPGLGTDPEVVFDSFYTTKITGTGIGLDISRKIAEAHGGRLTAENCSRSGGGALFRLSLPVKPAVSDS